MTVIAKDAPMVGQETLSPLVVEPAAQNGIRQFDPIATTGAESPAPVGQESLSPLVVEPAPPLQNGFREFDPIATAGAERAAPVGQETISSLIVEPASKEDPIVEYGPLQLRQEFRENVVTIDPLLTHNPPNIPATPDFIQSNPPGTPSGNILPDFHLRREPVRLVQDFSFKIAQIIPPNNPMGTPIDLVTYPYSTGTTVPPPALTQMLAWFDPNIVTIFGGFVIAAPNLAPGAPGIFTQTNPLWQPSWSPTAVNGTPGLVGSNIGLPTGGQGIKHLSGPIRPVLVGDYNGAAYTVIQAMVSTAPADPFGNLNAGAPYCMTSSLDGGVARVFGWMQQQTGFFATMFHKDSAGVLDAYTPGVASTFPAVWTFMSDGVTGFSMRRNGIAFGAPLGPPFAGGVVTALDSVGIGGYTNQIAAAHHEQDFCGNVGTTLLFQGVLDPVSLAYWENYVMGKTGL